MTLCQCSLDFTACSARGFVLEYFCENIGHMAKYVLASSIDANQKTGLISCKAIYSGETIIEERPLISSQYLWNAEYKYDACEFCLTPLETAQDNARRLSGDVTIVLPYTEQCCPTIKSAHVACSCNTRYCSSGCQAQAWQMYHKILCPSEPTNPPQLSQSISKLCDFWKSIHYPPETTSIMLLVKILASIKQSDKPSELISKINEFARFIEGNEEFVHKLLGEKFKDQIIVIRDMVVQIVYDTNLDQFYTEQGFTFLLSLISRHSQGIGTSSFSKWAKNCENLVANNASECEQINRIVENLFNKMDEQSGPFLNCEGSGLYQLSSQINHSCSPNAEVCFPFNNNVLVIKAIDNIEPGQEICICYLDECMKSRSRHSRMKYLEENYFFTCKCRKCESQINDPDVTSEEDSSDDEEESDMEMNCD